MSIEDLETQLGVPASEKKPADKPVASTAIEDTPEPAAKVKDKPAPEMLDNPIVKECHQIYKDGRSNDVEWRWHLGEKVDGIYADTSDKSEGVLKAISFVLDISTSDLSRFRKFFKSFKLEAIREKIELGYSWSHFKILNDIKDGLIKERVMNQIDAKGEAPKTVELQNTINKEKEQQLDSAAASSAADGDKGSSAPSPARPINGALKHIEKLNDCLADIFMQIKSGVDFASDKQEEKYNESMDDLKNKLRETIEVANSIIDGTKEVPQAQPE
ncbi:hypothetical protein CCP1ISM_20027 [Azospirillaceae bacterium]